MIASHFPFDLYRLKIHAILQPSHDADFYVQSFILRAAEFRFFQDYTTNPRLSRASRDQCELQVHGIQRLSDYAVIQKNVRSNRFAFLTVCKQARLAA